MLANYKGLQKVVCIYLDEVRLHWLAFTLQFSSRGIGGSRLYLYKVRH